MIRTLTIASLALSAAAASAQTVNLIMDVDEPLILPGDSTLVTLRAEFSTGDYALAGIMTDLVVVRTSGSIAGSWSDWELVAPMDGPGTTAGGPSGEYDMTGILAGQLNFPPAGIFADPSSPVAFWQATFTAGLANGIIDFETRTSRLDMYPEMMSGRSESRLDVVVEGTGFIAIAVPAPASAVVLLWLGVLGRRRRERNSL